MIVAVGGGDRHPVVPDDAIAVVEDAPDGTITQERVRPRPRSRPPPARASRRCPTTTDPQYQRSPTPRSPTCCSRAGCSARPQERGIEITDRQIDDELDEGQAAAVRLRRRRSRSSSTSPGFTLDEARQRIELQLDLEPDPEGRAAERPDASPTRRSRTYYDANIAQFEQPETPRRARHPDEDRGRRATRRSRRSEADPSPRPARGREEVLDRRGDQVAPAACARRSSQGQSEPALDEQIFSADQNELVGPFKGDAGYYVIEVRRSPRR